MSFPITLAIFTSTKGHYGKSTAEYTVNDLFSKIDPAAFARKVIHIKHDGPIERRYLVEKTAFFVSKGFEVLETPGKWAHFTQNHYIEHAKDIVTLMRSEAVQSQPFVFWMEDDVVYKSDAPSNHIFAKLGRAMNYLEREPEKTCVRILDREDILPSLQATGEEFNDIFAHRDCFSFRSNIMRSRDAWALASFFKNDYPNRMNIHIERYATEVLRCLSGGPIPFSCFKLDSLRHVHIGSEDFDENKIY